MLSRLFVLNKGQTICFSGKGEKGLFLCSNSLNLNNLKKVKASVQSIFTIGSAFFKVLIKISELTRENSHVAL